MKEYYKSGETAKKLGIGKATLTTYAKLGIFVPEIVTPKGYKMYSHRQIEEYKEKHKGEGNGTK